MVDGILEGRDVRRHYGIPAKRGTPPTTQVLQKWMVVHFLKLCEDDPETDEKDHRSRVANWWGKSPEQFRKLIAQHRTELEPVIKKMSIEAVEETARILQPEYKRLAHKSPN